ncbi:MAG: histone deacetylase [Planctomycetes bacterium]|nr:histone deacetylase [Planctomycetota bacterium]
MSCFVYSPAYYCDIGEHVFPVVKYRMLHDLLRKDPRFADVEFPEPTPVTASDLALVHTDQYIGDLLNCRWTARTRSSELPISRQIIDAYLIGAGGTLLAARSALEDGGASMNLTGGFHHCFPDHAEGFCYVNDVAIAIRRLQSDQKIRKAAVIDCDLHQGNGTAFIFHGDDSVFTFSIHQEHLYPVKEESNLDIGLSGLTRDDAYLRHIEEHIPHILDEFRPDIVFYLAGADPFEGDQLGNLRLTIHGLKKRDHFVLEYCAERRIPVAILAAGGYAVNTDDTIQIHYNTCLALLDVFGRNPEGYRP